VLVCVYVTEGQENWDLDSVIMLPDGFCLGAVLLSLRVGTGLWRTGQANLSAYSEVYLSFLVFEEEVAAFAVEASEGWGGKMLLATIGGGGGRQSAASSLLTMTKSSSASELE